MVTGLAPVLPLAAALLFGGSFAVQEVEPPAPQEEASPEPQSREEITPALEAAVQRGLKFLARRQGRGGDLSGSVPVASTALAVLSFMASGSTPHRGPYKDNILRGLEFLIKSTDRSGYITERGGMGSSGMYGHGFSALCMAEALGVIEDSDLYDRVSDAVRRAVRCIETGQNRFGGWNATPDGGLTDDASGAVAVMQVTALRAARNAGITVSQTVLDRARKYLIEMTNPDGWYQYNWNSRGGHRSSGLTGPGMYMLGALGLHDHAKYQRGIQNLMRAAPFLGGASGRDSGWSSWYHYTLFFVTLAVFQKGGEDWARYFPAMREDTLRRIGPDGSAAGDPYGGLYTSFVLLSLQMPFRTLPFFQEGGHGREGH